MGPSSLESTRQSLHGLAELVLAGPQYARSGDIRLRVTATGFATVAEPALSVEADALLAPSGRLPLVGTIASLAALAGVEPRDLRDVYGEGPTIGVEDSLEVDEQAAYLILSAFSRGEEAMRQLAPDDEPVLWPEHFDVGIAFDEVNYGVSPGDADYSEPYAYVGPWKRRTGPFWNAPFGAVRLMRELPGVDDVLEFFSAGGAHASDDPEAS
ncbi:MAG: hypothetical protein QOF35_2136 [Actinomycetota bacterium]|jgi:hypothetical protein|nr:hypothetical protein [Actinomycetota bacterium]